MKATNAEYNVNSSLSRMDSILQGADNNFQSLDYIPPRSRLTFTNGFYVQCSALFVDIRGSSQLPKKHRRPVLAKMYKAHLSEVVAAVNSDPHCSEVSIVGDCVSAVFDTPKKGDADSVVVTAARASSVVDVLNHKMASRNYQQISIGIGISHGTALMVKAGYSGSGINDVVWMGDVVNNASKLCGFGSKSASDRRVMLSKSFFERLSTSNQRLFKWNEQRQCYHGSIELRQIVQHIK